jgi:hypothetical protein
LTAKSVKDEAVDNDRMRGWLCAGRGHAQS